MLLRRSSLYVPANVQKFLEKAVSTRPDAICLDLEDSVPASEKETSRNLIKSSISMLRESKSDVLVRVNKDTSMAALDLNASCWPGLTGIIYPKVENAKEVGKIEELLGEIESKRGLPNNSVQIGVLIETARGFGNISEILGASRRITTVSIGHEDLCLDLGIQPTVDGQELMYVKSKLVIEARIHEVAPLGLMASLSDFTDLHSLRISALGAKKIGFKGAACIHPSQVPVLNEVFSPTSEEVEHANRVKTTFEGAISRGTAAVQLDGKMIDTPVYERAKLTLELHNEIQRRRD